MKRSAAPVLVLAALVIGGCAALPKETVYPGATALLPGTVPEMNSAGYWIGRSAAPDRLILDSDGIARLNESIRKTGAVRDLAALEGKRDAELRKELAETIRWVAGLEVYQAKGRKVNAAFLGPIEELMDIEGVGTEVPAYAFLVRRCDIRVLPTTDGLFDGPGDRFIDNLQASSLEPGTPLVILHASRDGAWLYAATELLSGWIPESAAARTDYRSFTARYKEAPSVIVLSARADLYEDEGLRRFITYARMGTRLVLAGQRTGPRIKVSLPDRDEEGRFVPRYAWVDSAAVSAFPLPYTPRSIYGQAFALLNAPYGWGGSFGEQDCSQFLCEVFATVGVTLPRNSSSQAKAGFRIPGFAASTSDEDKVRLLAEEGIGGATLLRYPGHIMLYLGAVEGKPYIIHETWAYREKRGLSERNRLINRVVVSDLELGAGTKRGTHLRRLTDATLVSLP